MTDWRWCQENPKDAAAEIDRLHAEVARARAAGVLEGKEVTLTAIKAAADLFTAMLKPK
jgi:hypothetical protein